MIVTDSIIRQRYENIYELKKNIKICIDLLYVPS